ncbi:MAG TPA: permease [Polyangia bacterium]
MFWTTVTHLLGKLWHEIVFIAPYLLVGVLLEATIRTFKWHLKLRHALVRLGPFAVLAAVALGVVSPLCACATLPLVIALMQGGLPLAPAMALLVSAPLMSPAAYVMLARMLGAGWANVIVGCAVALGLLAGLVTHLLRPYGFAESEIFRRELPPGDFHDHDYPVGELRCACGHQLSHRVARRTGNNRVLVFLARVAEGGWKIGRFALIGVAVEVVASALIPAQWITRLLTGDGVWPTIAITFATIPLHLPQVTAASMVYGFFLPEPGQVIPLAKGPGIALLVGGPVTALPVMAVFLSMFKPRVLALYLGICIGGTLLLALTYHFLPFKL